MFEGSPWWIAGLILPVITAIVATLVIRAVQGLCLIIKEAVISALTISSEANRLLLIEHSKRSVELWVQLEEVNKKLDTLLDRLPDTETGPQRRRPV